MSFFLKLFGSSRNHDFKLKDRHGFIMDGLLRMVLFEMSEITLCLKSGTKNKVKDQNTLELL